MEIRKENEQATIVPGDKIDLSNSVELKNEFLRLLDQGIRDVVLDFRNVELIDSSGLGKLLLFQKELREEGGTLKIVNIESDYVDKMFRVIHLDEVIDIE